MATSGTVGQTTIDTAKVLEHAFRRCGIGPEKQTPERVQTALECLFFLLTYLATRGINLWCVANHYIPLYAGQRVYALPSGSIQVLNALFHSPTTVTGTVTDGTTDYIDDLGSDNTVVRFGLKLDAAPSGPVTVSASDDGVTYTVFKTIAVADYPTTLTWYDVDPQVSGSYFKVTDTGQGPTLDVGTLYLSTGGSEVTVSQYSRDEYAQQPNKTVTGGSVTNFFFEKLLTPQVSCMPVPNADGMFLSVWVHRQVEDVGSLTQSLAIPFRWFDAVITHLAFRLAISLDGVDPSKITLLKQLADEMVLTTELDETDRSPIMIRPNIGVYTA